ncbi:MAG: hypothetical protein HDQ93_04175 [Desulfovibrio sp.]|nr:hypothetical protein [Desulfovibrio sp.]
MARRKETSSGLVLVFLAIFIFFAGCVRRPPPIAHRPHAAYLHWLENQSMLSKAPRYISQVSQSERVWLNSTSRARPDILLAAAPEWAKLSPASPDFYKRASADLEKIVALGIRGVFLGQLGENLDIWLSEPGSPSGAPAASLDPSSGYGPPEDFSRLLERAEAAGLEIGSDLPSASTGRGPDFILQARNAGGHQGLYAMIPLPDNFEALPAAQGEWDASILGEKIVSELSEMGILPKSVSRDKYDWASSGWAVTGNVSGIDGKPRRWLYRFEKTPKSPVILWQDPSGAARQIFSAAIIRQTGLDGQSLLGISAGAWMGLEPISGLGEEGKDLFSPGIEAVNDLARQIAQYGGWALQIDPVPPTAILEVLAGACDFCVDELTPLALLDGMRAGDASSLALLYGAWIKNRLPFNRLAHGFNARDNIPAALLNHIPESASKIDSRATLEAVSLEETKREGMENLPEAFRELAIDWALSLPGLAFLELNSLDASRLEKGRLDLLRARGRHKLALAATERVSVPAGGTLTLFHRLPDGAGWLSILNLAKTPREVAIDLPKPARRALDAVENRSLDDKLSADRRKIRLALDVWQAQNVLLYWE